MEPNIWEGDVVLMDTSENRVSDDTVYVMKRHGYLVVKRLQRTFDGSVKVKSDHPAYDDEMIAGRDVEHLEIVGRVVWTGGKL